MKTSQYFQIILAFVLTLTIIFVNAGIAQYNTSRLVQTKDQVPRTWQVKHRIQTILSTLVDAETGQRGFLLTANKTFLEPYDKALNEIELELSDLEKLTLDDAVQHKNLLDLRLKTGDFLLVLKQHIEDRKSNGANSYDLASLTQSKDEMDSLREKLFVMGGLEEKRLESRAELSKVSETRTRLTFFIATVGAILSVSVALFLFQRLVTERRRAEVEIQAVLSALEEKVAERTLVLAQVNSSLAEANGELEAFSYSVSHDLRAPLRHIGGFVEMLQKKESERLSENGKRQLNIIAESVKYGGLLVDDLLAFSKMSRADLNFQSVDMNWMVEEAREKLALEIGDRKVEWNIQSLPTAIGDATTLYLVWENLIHNALKYSRNSATSVIQIGYESDETETRYFVRDNGVGFDMQYVGKLFGVFQRLHAKEQFEGTGIGLANVQRLVKRHGGRTWAEGELDIGATFWFALPASQILALQTTSTENPGNKTISKAGGRSAK